MADRWDVYERRRALWSGRLVIVVGLALLVLAVVLMGLAIDDGDTSAAAWIPIALIGVTGSACILWAADVAGRLDPSRTWIPCTLAVAAGLGLGVVAAVFANDRASAVVWGAATGLLVDAAITAFLSYWVLRPRTPAPPDEPRRRRRGRDSWDPRDLFPRQSHWDGPGADKATTPAAAATSPAAAAQNPEAEVVLREIGEAAWLAFSRANLQRRYARGWQTAQFAIGLPAALLAGLAGASSLSDLHGQWRTVVGVLGLIGAGLASLATALNAGKRAEEAKLLATRLDAVGRSAHAYRETNAIATKLGPARKYLSELLARTDVLMGANAGTLGSPAAAVGEDGDPQSASA
ncbi:MAG TPA: hypothetical protein VKB57_02120 [Acidimicrobiales bacterium]|nr:hypothetical protein [Acidimicrobiales bacterium]